MYTFSFPSTSDPPHQFRPIHQFRPNFSAFPTSLTNTSDHFRLDNNFNHLPTLPTVFDSSEMSLRPSAVHITGPAVQSQSTKRVESYVTVHTPAKHSIEWVNDESFNVVFATTTEAADFLAAISLEQHHDPPTERPIIPFPAQPQTEDSTTETIITDEQEEAPLMGRICLDTDKKPANAAAQSRYYIYNPEAENEKFHTPKNKLQVELFPWKMGISEAS